MLNRFVVDSRKYGSGDGRAGGHQLARRLRVAQAQRIPPQVADIS